MGKGKKIIFGVLLAIVVIGISYAIYFFVKYDLLVCKSSEGNIILVYDKEQLVNFGTTGSMSFSFENQKSYVEKIGIESYIISFEKSFEKNTNGKCR